MNLLTTYQVVRTNPDHSTRVSFHDTSREAFNEFHVQVDRTNGELQTAVEVFKCKVMAISQQDSDLIWFHFVSRETLQYVGPKRTRQ